MQPGGWIEHRAYPIKDLSKPIPYYPRKSTEENIVRVSDNLGGGIDPDFPDFAPSGITYVPHISNDRHWLMLAVILNSALYLGAVFVAGLLTGHVIAWRLAVITLGTCYLAPLVQITSTGPLARIIATAIVAWSIVLGLAALVMLLI